jgi:hypothetical protein
MKFTITENEGRGPVGKLADVALHFEDSDSSVLAGLQLQGFGIWELRIAVDPVYAGGRIGVLTVKRTVTFPARSYTVNAERRVFALLRPSSSHVPAQQAGYQLTQAILAAYAEHMAQYDARGLAK